MNYNDAFILANMDGQFIEGFVKCTFVQLYDKAGHSLFTIKGSYLNWPNIAFRRKEDGKFGVRAESLYPICRAYTYKEKPGRVPVILSPELAYVMKQLILTSPTAPDTWKLWRRWKKDDKRQGKNNAHKKGDKELLTTQYDMPDLKNSKQSGPSYVVEENAYFVTYWNAPQYVYALTDRYLTLLELVDNGEPVYVKPTAIDWYTDAQVVTTIEDNIILSDDGHNDLIVDEDGEIVKLYDQDGNEIETDEFGRPIIPETKNVQVGTEALAAAKKQLDQAKTILAATSAVSFL